MVKAVFSKKKILCRQETGLKFKEEISKKIFGAELCMVLKFEDASESRSEISWQLKSGAGEGWRRSVGLSMWKMKKVLHRFKEGKECAVYNR